MKRLNVRNSCEVSRNYLKVSNDTFTSICRVGKHPSAANFCQFSAVSSMSCRLVRYFKRLREVPFTSYIVYSQLIPKDRVVTDFWSGNEWKSTRSLHHRKKMTPNLFEIYVYFKVVCFKNTRVFSKTFRFVQVNRNISVTHLVLRRFIVRGVVFTSFANLTTNMDVKQ